MRPSLGAFIGGRATMLLVLARRVWLVMLVVAFLRISPLAMAARLVLIVSAGGWLGHCSLLACRQNCLPAHWVPSLNSGLQSNGCNKGRSFSRLRLLPLQAFREACGHSPPSLARAAAPCAFAPYAAAACSGVVRKSKAESASWPAWHLGNCPTRVPPASSYRHSDQHCIA